MPRDSRLADTIDFLNGGSRDNDISTFGPAVATILDGYTAMLPPSVNDAMGMSRQGDARDRRLRRAIVAIRCLILGSLARETQAVAKAIQPNQLKPILIDLMRMALRVNGRSTIRPLIDRLMRDPEAFLTANRIKTGYIYGRSTSATFDFYHSPYHDLYNIDPVNPNRNLPFAPIRAFSFHVQQFKDVAPDMGNIVGARATEDLVITTQLSGCSVLYRVNGPNLDVAHIQPTADHVWFPLPPNLQHYAGSPKAVIMGKFLEAHGALAGEGGTLGLYRQAPTDANTRFRPGRRAEGTRDARINVHGYWRRSGADYAYFIAVRRAGSWEIFGQENATNNPGEGIKRIQRLYPL